MSAPTSDKAGIRQTIRALRAAGWELDFVCNQEDDIPVKTEDEAIQHITAVDEAFLNVKAYDRRGHVFFVLGNSPDEVICDYTTNLSSVIEPLTDSWF